MYKTAKDAEGNYTEFEYQAETDIDVEGVYVNCNWFDDEITSVFLTDQELDALVTYWMLNKQ